MTFQTTRRDSLGLLGVGLSALTGCGGSTETDTSGSSGSGGMAGEGTSGSSAQGGEAAGGASSAGAGNGEGGVPGAGEGGAGSPAEGGQGGAGEVPECVTKNEATAGPYPNLSPLNRKDVRGSTTGIATPKEGAELVLRIRVMDLDAFCAPIADAVVDIWQCDALGLYAGYEPFATMGEDFLRGYQKTDAAGVAEFLTIFPGSYPGRALHIHFSIRASEGTLVQNASGPSLRDVFVAQLYFGQADANEVFATYPIYMQGAAITPNGLDGIFNIGGDDLIVAMSKSLTGYIGSVTIGVSRAAIGL